MLNPKGVLLNQKGVLLNPKGVLLNPKGVLLNPNASDRRICIFPSSRLELFACKNASDRRICIFPSPRHFQTYIHNFGMAPHFWPWHASFWPRHARLQKTGPPPTPPPGPRRGGGGRRGGMPRPEMGGHAEIVDGGLVYIFVYIFRLYFLYF